MWLIVGKTRKGKAENTRGDYMKLKKYIRMIVISLVMTLTMLLKMCECITETWTILCDFIAMLGGGHSLFNNCFMDY